MEVTTTRDGTVRTRVTTTTQTVAPDEPTDLPTAMASESNTDQRVLKYFPTAVPKTQSTSNPTQTSHEGGLSTTALGSLIGGAVAFLVVVIIIAYMLIRNLNKMIAQVASYPQPYSTPDEKRGAGNFFKPHDPEIDRFSINPFISSPQPSWPTQLPGNDIRIQDPTLPRELSPELSALSITPASYAGAGGLDISPASPGYGRRGAMKHYFDSLPWVHRNSTPVSYTMPHNSGTSFGMGGGGSSSTLRKSSFNLLASWGRSSDQRREVKMRGEYNRFNAGSPSELEARWYIPELPETTQAVTRDERRKASANAGNLPELVKKEMEKRQMGERRVGLGLISGEGSGKDKVTM